MIDVKKFKLVSDQIEYDELTVIVREADKLLKSGATGSFVELGCYNGTTSLFISRLLKQYNASNEFHVYDSFQGLPKKRPEDESPIGTQFTSGELHASKKAFIKHYAQAGLPLPIIHTAWFESMKPGILPDTISFAFLDGDFYSSILSSLQLLELKLNSGTTIIVDDYANEALPGARLATDRWAAQHGLTVVNEKSLGIIRI